LALERNGTSYSDSSANDVPDPKDRQDQSYRDNNEIALIDYQGAGKHGPCQHHGGEGEFYTARASANVLDVECH
jgi:hypothetical protein